jgi:hypothetical protein
MTAGMIVALLAMALVVAGTLITYERLLAAARAERDELLDILDANVDDMRRMARERHPSAAYGGANLRVVR